MSPRWRVEYTSDREWPGGMHGAGATAVGHGETLTAAVADLLRAVESVVAQAEQARETWTRVHEEVSDDAA